MFRPFNSRSIKHSLILGIAAVHAVLMSIFIYDLTQRERAFLLQESKDATIGITKTLALNSINGVLSHDLVGLEEILNAQSEHPNFIFALVFDTKGQVLAYHHTSLPDAKAGQFVTVANLAPPHSSHDSVIIFDDENVFEVASPIFINQHHIGWVRVQISRNNITDSLQLVTYEGLIYTLVAIIIGTIFAWLMGQQLTKDIYKLITATQQVRSGQRAVQLELSRKDELQTLSQNLQAMLTTLEQNESELHNEMERAEITLQSIGDGVITTDFEGRVTYLNPVAENLTYWPNQQAVGKPIEEIFKTYDRHSMQATPNTALQAIKTGEIKKQADHVILINRHGEKLFINDSGAPIIDKNGKVVGSVLVFNDSTTAENLRAELSYQASHDSLTKLHNRAAFESRLDTLIDTACEDPEREHSLLYIDLDEFKIVNDTAGHTAGDELLKQVATLIKDELRSGDLLARIGGDEFTILIENCPLKSAREIAEKVRKTVSEYRFIWHNRTFQIGTSIGITQIQGATNKAIVMSQADVACYLAKDNGRNCIHVFRADDASVEKTYNQFDWVEKIKTALEKHDFLLYAQELVPLQNKHANKSYEILVRLQSKSGTIIPPDQFLPAAERFNLMGKLDIYIIQQAMNWLNQNSHQIEILNINISAQSLESNEFSQSLLKLLQKNTSTNHKLCFEITETTAITHMASSIRFLHQIKKHGCKLALDDFGSGFSSFSWLKKLPVDFVKIDGAFILDVLTDKVDAAMVKSLHLVSLEMGIQSIAEFVENEAVEKWLTEAGIDYAQGYHFHKPCPIEQIFPEEQNDTETNAKLA